MTGFTEDIATYTPPKSFIDSSNRQYILLNRLYNHNVVGVEFTGSVNTIAEQIGSTYSPTNRLIEALEDRGIITRRLEYNKGRVAYFTLVKPLAEATALLKSYQVDMMVGLSLRQRILSLFKDNATFTTMRELGDMLQVNGGSTDFHNLTHVLHALKREGTIAFSHTTTKDKVPYNIRLTNTKRNAKRFADKPVETVVESVVEPVNVMEVLPVIAHKPLERPVEAGESFPLIERLVNRKDWLEAAAMLAENAEAEDISILLQERAGVPLTGLEAEAIRLMNAYNECKDN